MRIGIDLGGTKIEGLVLDKGGVERERLRVPTPASSYEEDVAAIVELIAELERRAGTRCTVGIAHPGAISPATGLVKNANSTRLNGRPLKADLERRLGREVRLANDANCFAVSEASDGAAAGCSIVFGVILGTGVGGGVVIDGRPLTGAQAIAGEWGHNPLPLPARQRAARPALLLRPHRLHRDLAERAPPARSVRGAHRPQPARHRHRPGGARRRCRGRPAHGALLRPAGARAGRRSSTSSTRTPSCWAAASRA